MKLNLFPIKTTLALLCTSFAILVASAEDYGTPVASTIYGGSVYALVQKFGITWDKANEGAVAFGGHLASLTSEAETLGVYNGLYGHGFLSANSAAPEAWIGGFTTDPNFTTHSPDHWAWTTGELWTAFDAGNFGPGEPNGDSTGLTINRYQTSKWNDEGSWIGGIGGYIVEFAPKTNPGPTPVPEPSTVAGAAVFALLSGMWVAGTRRRRFLS
jgi:hypothetical protein